MASFERHCDVTWEGPIKEGKGEAKAGTGAFTLPVSFPSRVEQPGGKTSPEELMAAAHASCYAMAMTATMGRRGASATRLQVSATIEAAVGATGIQIQASHLKVKAEGLQGVSAADFPLLAREGEPACPVSNAYRGALTIDVQAEGV